MILIPYLRGVQIWARWVNARGGVNGHQVSVISADDGADPARHRAEIQEMIERDHVLAFLNNAGAITGQPSLAYLEAKRIPLIGLTTGEAWAYDSPMQFPQATSGLPLTVAFWASWAQQSLARDIQKVAIVSCAEVQLCKDIAAAGEREGPRRGIQLVYKAQVSLAQPDFTAECLSSRNAGAEVIVAALDPSSISRLLASCLRQQYHPIIATGGQGTVDEMKADERLQDRFLSNTNTVPYVQSGTPATDEFQAAVKEFGGSAGASAGIAGGWVSGKLFEKAASAMPEPPTTETILKGLWRIKDDDLGGLTQPLTFVEGQKPVPTIICWWNLALSRGRWTSPDGYQRHCEGKS